MSMADIIAEEARLIILRELAGQVNYALNESMLQQVLETFGIARPRDWVRAQLSFLEGVGAVTVMMAGSVMVATMTNRGLDHVTRRHCIEGIKRPSPGL